MEQIAIYLLMALKFINLKEKTLKLIQFHCVQEIFQKMFFVDNIKKTRFHEYVYDFSVDYNSIAVDAISDIQKYVMKKINICAKQ